MALHTNFTIKYQLSLERNLASTLKWLMLISQSFGAAPVNLSIRPMKVGGNQEPGCTSKRWNRLIAWTHYIWCALIISVMLSSMYLHSRNAFKLTVARLLDLIEYVFNTSNVLIVIFGCNYQHRWYSQYFKNFIEIDMKLQRCGGKLYPGTLKRFLRNFAFAGVSFFVFAVVNDFFFRRFDIVYVMRSLTSYLMPNIIATLSIIQYYCVLHIIRERIGQITYILQRLLTEHKHTLGCDYRLKGSVLAVISLDNCASSPTKTEEKAKSFNDVPAEVILNSLRGVFHDITVINANINQSFGVLVIALATSTFVIVCTQLYTFYKLAEGPETMNAFLTIYSALWVILHSARVFGILYLNSKVEEEKSNIAPILYQMDFFGKINMADIELCINKFSLQILHEKRYQTACGILKLDLTLVTTIVGALTTYLVILIQFDSNSRNMANLTSPALATSSDKLVTAN